MASSIAAVAQEINEMLLKSGENVITMSYPEFYSAVERERIKDAFRAELENRLRERGLLICFGAMVVAVLKDFRFSPAKN